MPGLKEWLAKASGDLKAAKYLLQDDDVLDISVYHTHQSAEKSLKTYMVFRQSSIPKTHDLQRLLELCTQKDSSFLTLLDEVLTLNPYGIYSRYPDDRFVINKEDAEEAIVRATKILRFVEKKIKISSNKTTSNATINLFEK